ncbi:hypothetical protein PrebiDRAFT_0265 [Prevotella bivia DSM 20514]|uniref:Uncharacterized protein n=1 Tax=Prevotella bivia DSM 20514 TaxID=868129 RepID=I4Z758_9BACT|nr:hypothetical protein PrebiDRAFT_0265 [Prevotella bivia DSM 20514]
MHFSLPPKGEQQLEEMHCSEMCKFQNEVQ